MRLTNYGNFAVRFNFEIDVRESLLVGLISTSNRISEVNATEFNFT